VLEIFAGFQAFTWRTCPLPLGTVVGNSILNKDLRILIKDASLLSTDLDSGNCSCTKVITIILDRLSFAPRENLRTPATLLTGEKKQKFHR
jgi:hypothetical protein